MDARESAGILRRGQHASVRDHIDNTKYSTAQNQFIRNQPKDAPVLTVLATHSRVVKTMSRA